MSGLLPFRATVGLPDTMGDAQILLEITGKISNKLQQSDKVLANFVTCAEGGMFSGERIHPTESRIKVVSHESEANRIRCFWTTHGIDPGAFRILLGVLSHRDRRMQPLDEVRLTGTPAAANEWGLQAVLSCPFPGRVRKVPFELELKPFFFESSEPLIRMEFQRELRDEQFDQIKTIVNAWDDIVSLGGYLELSTRDVGSFPEPGEFYLAEPTVLEHAIYAFEGPEATFDAVVNMAVYLHSTTSRLASLVIE